MKGAIGEWLEARRTVDEKRPSNVHLGKGREIRIFDSGAVQLGLRVDGAKESSFFDIDPDLGRKLGASLVSLFGGELPPEYVPPLFHEALQFAVFSIDAATKADPSSEVVAKCRAAFPRLLAFVEGSMREAKAAAEEQPSKEEPVPA